MSFKDYFEVYTFDCELPGTGEKVEYKPLTTKEIKKLLVYEDENPEKVEEILDQIIQGSVVNEDFDIDKLYLQDRFFLLLEIRKKTKGEKYEFQFDCPKCETQNYLVKDLDKLEVTRLSHKEDLNTEVSITDDLSVNLWFITRGEEKEALEKTGDNSSQKEAESYLNILAQTIKAVNSPDGKEENLSFEDKQFIMDRLTTGNLTKISNWFSENNFGVDFKVEKKCRQCKYSETTTIPLQNFFF